MRYGTGRSLGSGYGIKESSLFYDRIENAFDLLLPGGLSGKLAAELLCVLGYSPGIINIPFPDLKLFACFFLVIVRIIETALHGAQHEGKLGGLGEFRGFMLISIGNIVVIHGMLQTSKTDANGSEFHCVFHNAIYWRKSAHVENFIPRQSGEPCILVDTIQIVSEFYHQALLQVDSQQVTSRILGGKILAAGV